MLNRRVQLLFSKDQWNKVVKNARSEKISAGEFIRRAIEEYFKVIKTPAEEKRPISFKGFFKPGNK